MSLLWKQGTCYVTGAIPLSQKHNTGAIHLHRCHPKAFPKHNPATPPQHLSRPPPHPKQPHLLPLPHWTITHHNSPLTRMTFTFTNKRMGKGNMIKGLLILANLCFYRGWKKISTPQISTRVSLHINEIEHVWKINPCSQIQLNSPIPSREQSVKVSWC